MPIAKRLQPVGEKLGLRPDFLLTHVCLSAIDIVDFVPCVAQNQIKKTCSVTF
ncbi:MAG: hypothetical protein HC883_01815 [Bdellovibrionaceae bacterium]|nr:hypothetical protein [Pseudobdellovibrionaceae bacterium]